MIDPQNENNLEQSAAQSEILPEDQQEKELFQYDDPGTKKKKTKKKDHIVRHGFVRKLMPLFILVGALALLATAYFVLRTISPETDGDDQINMVKVLSLNSGEVKTVTVKNRADQYVLYKKAGSVYKIKGKEDKPVDSDVVLGSIQYLSAIESTKRIMVPNEKLGDYGLATPASTVTLETSKKTVVLYLGAKTAGDEYYLSVKDDPESKDGQTAVYLLSQTQSNVCLADRFYYYETNLSGYDSSADAEKISPLRIGGKKGTAVNVYMSDAETGLAYMMDDPINMPFSTSVMNSVLSLLTTMNNCTPVDDDVSAENLEKLGLADAQYVLDFENNTAPNTLLFGNTDEQGMVYCMKKGGNVIYQIDAAAISCLSIDIADMCDVITYTRDVDTVSRILLTSGAKTYDIKTEGTGEDRVVHVNNKQVESSIFSEFYAYLLGMEVQRQGEKPQGDPYLTLEITLREDGSKEYLRYYAVDERYCFYEFNGSGMFYISRQAVDSLLSNAQKVYDNEEIVTAW